ncbi:hypothetical protein J6500_31240, partial [Bradyrhizobium sp. WSM 1704]|uniref:Ig-like domain-containing protein n=1 Tax=Bradyrhizobium semiaridum TaxID=2821404 RepID=UPI001CE2470C
DLDRSTFNDHNNTGTVTFTFSEVPSGFDLADVSVTGGGLSNLQPVVGNPLQYTATFTADDNSTTAVAISVAADKFTDPVGNDNLASNTDTATVDTQNPTVVVEIADASLSDGHNSSNVTFTFSEAVSAATVATLAGGAGITVAGGTLSALSWAADHTSATATFTATDGITASGSVTVDANSYTDVAGNLGSTGADTVAIDTQNPTVVVDLDRSTFNDHNNTGTVTFTFSEVPSGFDLADVSVTGGGLSNLQPVVGNPLQYTATFTADDNSTTAVAISVAADKFTDPVGNDNLASNTDTATVDTQNPTVVVEIVDGALSDGDNNSNVTFTFSEAVSAATVATLAEGAGITVVGGTLSALSWAADHTSATATFTATDGITASGSVTVDANAYTDVAGNLGSTGTDTVAIDTQNPTVVVEIVDGALSDGHNSSVVTFTFSEAPVGFTAADISATHGTVSNLAATADPLVFTATFTAADGFTGNGSVSVTAGSYTDAALNLGGTGTDSVTIDTENPTVVVDLDRSTFNDHNNTGTVTFTFSEVPSGFDLADVSVTGGGLSNLQPVVGNPLQYTATFTADDNSTTAVAISVAADKFTDPVGNDNLASNTDTATV